MTENLLHFIWKFRLFDCSKLKTIQGEPIEVLHPGTHNTHAGADFQNAKIKIADTAWVGNVEIHIQGDDWFTHGHQNDKAYDNVVLHVVYRKGNRVAIRSNHSEVSTIELEQRINPHTLSRYESLAQNQSWIPCEKFYAAVDDFTKKAFMERLLIERLEQKVAAINSLLHQSDNDWENVMFRMVAQYLGASINKQPFLQLAESLPVKIWAKYQHDTLQTEALVFGQAGLLQQPFDDEYANQLRKEFTYLKRLHGLTPIQKETWKFLRLRPANFPTIRLAQLAALMSKEVKLFSAILHTKDSKALHKLFDVEVSAYWKRHYLFDKPTTQTKSHLGTGTKNVLVINAVAPVLFAYGKYKQEELYCERAIQLLDDSKPDSNTVITGWKNLGQQCSSAADSQSLLQLKTAYCNRFRCLECAIGAKILQ